MQNLFEALKQSWPSPIVARADVAAFSGGLLHPRTMANLDCRGQGPEERITVGRSVAYGRDSLVSWMEARTSSAE